MLLGEVLNIQGQVQVTNAQGRRRVLRRGERLQPGDRLEMEDGATLVLRHADGQEEVLHGAPLLQKAAASPADLTRWLDEEGGVIQSMTQERFALAALADIQPEAGLIEGGEHNGGHGFVRVERLSLPRPHSELELVPCCLPASGGVAQPGAWTELPLVNASAIARAPAEGEAVAPVSFSREEEVYVADLLEGAGFLRPNTVRTEIVTRQISSALPFLDDNGEPLGAHYSFSHQHSRLDLTLMRQEPAVGGGSAYVYLVTQQTQGEQMPNIPFRQVETMQDMVWRADGSRVIFITRITGMVDRAPDQLIHIQEHEVTELPLIDMALEAAAQPRLMAGVLTVADACRAEQGKDSFAPVEMLSAAAVASVGVTDQQSLEFYLLSQSA